MTKIFVNSSIFLTKINPNILGADWGADYGLRDRVERPKFTDGNKFP